jgi:hypothetical protein
MARPHDGFLEGARMVAMNLLDILDDATIAQKTGLALDEVNELRNAKK